MPRSAGGAWDLILLFKGGHGAPRSAHASRPSTRSRPRSAEGPHADLVPAGRAGLEARAASSAWRRWRGCGGAERRGDSRRRVPPGGPLDDRRRISSRLSRRDVAARDGRAISGGAGSTPGVSRSATSGSNVTAFDLARGRISDRLAGCGPASVHRVAPSHLVLGRSPRTPSCAGGRRPLGVTGGSALGVEDARRADRAPTISAPATPRSRICWSCRSTSSKIRQALHRGAWRATPRARVIVDSIAVGGARAVAAGSSPRASSARTRPPTCAPWAAKLGQGFLFDAARTPGGRLGRAVAATFGGERGVPAERVTRPARWLLLAGGMRLRSAPASPPSRRPGVLGAPPPPRLDQRDLGSLPRPATSPALAPTGRRGRARWSKPPSRDGWTATVAALGERGGRIDEDACAVRAPGRSPRTWRG